MKTVTWDKLVESFTLNFLSSGLSRNRRKNPALAALIRRI
ncbi:hypothetical protein UYSO10_4570 [Kosakonia radicincitans]|nr:hypothetical protein UYSO10_4570 [Kosakonia radicincitans]